MRAEVFQINANESSRFSNTEPLVLIEILFQMIYLQDVPINAIHLENHLLMTFCLLFESFRRIKKLIK